MNDYSHDFGPFHNKVWLNCASEGAIPKVAAQAAQEAIEWKQAPYEMTFKRFAEVPKNLKKSIAKLMHVDAQDVILGNSATYGIHLFANGLPFDEGDEILVMQNDFPTDILPWLALEKKRVVVKQLKPKAHVLSPDEVQKNLTSKVKVVCLAHVHTFSGHVIDIRRIGEMCRAKGVIFIVNFSQSLGNTPIDLSQLPVDGMTTAAFKWLCGPFGTGFCWATPELRKKIDYDQAFWGNVLSEDQLMSEEELSLPDLQSAKKYDVFGTANFFNFKPLTASIEYLLGAGIKNIHDHNDQLVGQIIDGLDALGYELISPPAAQERSNLVVFTHKDQKKNRDIFHRLLDEGIYLAMWKGKLRAAPHLFNTQEDIQRLLSILKEWV